MKVPISINPTVPFGPMAPGETIIKTSNQWPKKMMQPVKTIKPAFLFASFDINNNIGKIKLMTMVPQKIHV